MYVNLCSAIYCSCSSAPILYNYMMLLPLIIRSALNRDISFTINHVCVLQGLFCLLLLAWLFVPVYIASGVSVLSVVHEQCHYY